jgi:hypothetical protein
MPRLYRMTRYGNPMGQCPVPRPGGFGAAMEALFGRGKFASPLWVSQRERMEDWKDERIIKALIAAIDLEMRSRHCLTTWIFRVSFLAANLRLNNDQFSSLTRTLRRPICRD